MCQAFLSKYSWIPITIILIIIKIYMIIFDSPLLFVSLVFLQTTWTKDKSFFTLMYMTFSAWNSTKPVFSNRPFTTFFIDNLIYFVLLLQSETLSLKSKALQRLNFYWFPLNFIYLICRIMFSHIIIKSTQ